MYSLAQRRGTLGCIHLQAAFFSRIGAARSRGEFGDSRAQFTTGYSAVSWAVPWNDLGSRHRGHDRGFGLFLRAAFGPFQFGPVRVVSPVTLESVFAIVFVALVLLCAWTGEGPHDPPAIPSASA